MEKLESANAYVLLIAKKATRARARAHATLFESDPTNDALHAHHREAIKN